MSLQRKVVHVVNPSLALRFVALAALASLAAAPRTAHAEPPTSCATEPELLATSSCPAIFGDARTHRLNRGLRTDAIEGIDVGEHCIDLVHSAGWYTPTAIQYRSLSLLETRRVPGCPPLAVVHLDSQIVDVDCPSGLYALRLDDALGASARVLAILDGVVLIESDDALAYLWAGDAEQPVWRLTWQSPWRFKVPKNYGKTGGSPRKKPTPRKPARKKR